MMGRHRPAPGCSRRSMARESNAAAGRGAHDPRRVAVPGCIRQRQLLAGGAAGVRTPRAATNSRRRVHAAPRSLCRADDAAPGLRGCSGRGTVSRCSADVDGQIRRPPPGVNGAGRIAAAGAPARGRDWRPRPVDRNGTSRRRRSVVARRDRQGATVRPATGRVGAGPNHLHGDRQSRSGVASTAPARHCAPAAGRMAVMVTRPQVGVPSGHGV